MSKQTTLHGAVTFKEITLTEDLVARILAIDANGNLVDRPAITTSGFITTSLADGRVWIGSSGGAATAVDTAAVGDIDADSVAGLTIKAGAIVNADINASAAIVYSKLSLANSILNADVNSAAAIAYSKLNLAGTIVNADVAAAAAIARTKTASGTAYRLVVNNASGVMSENAAITANRALVSDANGQPTQSATTADEIGYISGLTGDLQGQLDDEIATQTVNAVVKAPTVAEHGYAITWDNSAGEWNLTDPVVQGIPLGGDTREVLAKIDGSDWNAEWIALELSDITDVSASVDDLNLLAGLQAAGLTGVHLGHLIGASSNLQTQINGKLAASLAQNALFVGNSSNVPTSLAAGSDGQVLSISSGVPTWSTLVGTGTVTSVDVSGGTTGLTTTGGPISTSGTITLTGTLIAANGGTGFASYTVGDILYASTTTAFSKLGVGSNGNVLTLAGGVPSWAAPAGGISGLTTNRVPYAASATTLADDSAFTWDSTNNALTIGTARIFTIAKTLDDLFIGEGVGNFTTTGTGLNLGVGGTSGAGATLAALTSGVGNAAFGQGALTLLQDGISNVAIGGNTLSSNVSGDYNVAVGASALLAVTGDRNIGIGYNIADSLTTGADNIVLGYQAATSLTTGSSNVVIGSSVDVLSATASGQLSIQNIIFGTGNVQTGTTVSTGNVGIGRSPLADKFEVWHSGTQLFGITTDGRLYGNALHNNAGSLTGTTKQYIASGTYSPTCTSVANLDSTPTVSAAKWIRVGNVVQVSAIIAVNATSAATLTEFKMTLPIASNLGNGDCSGTGAFTIAVGTAIDAVYIWEDAAANESKFSYYPTTASAGAIVCTFQYEIK